MDSVGVGVISVLMEKQMDSFIMLLIVVASIRRFWPFLYIRFPLYSKIKFGKCQTERERQKRRSENMQFL